MRFRGAFIVSRVATVAPERISAYAFLAVSYILPSPDSDYEMGRKVTAELAGYEILGYQQFFAEDDAATVLEKNVCFDFVSQLYFPEQVLIKFGLMLVSGIRSLELCSPRNQKSGQLTLGPQER